jgi:RHS repeat-associated protein
VDADGAGPAKAWTEYYVYDGQHVALVYRDPDGPSGAQPAVLRARVLHGEAVDQVLAQEDVTTLSTPGTVRDVVNSQGQVRNHLVYDAFGKVVSETNAAVDFLFGYTGRERDEETGLHYYRARYYDPAVGRFVSEDPIGFAAGDANLYRYVGNEVTNATDPSGLWRIIR